jgi:type III pantothenate kinase
MSTLLVDIGNTRVKWAVARGAALSRMGAAVHGGDPAATRAVIKRAPADVDRIVAVSVAGPRFERALAAAAKARFGARPEFVRSTRAAHGVRNGYRDPWRLGADRWVGVIGARELTRGKAVLVANIGTALTLDAVGADGLHLGGAIAPGPVFMVESLLAGTHGIRRRARGDAANGARLFASNTASAIAAGARFAAAALIERAVEEASRALGSRPVLLLTGGGAADLGKRVRVPGRVVPDLVLHGLGVFARGSTKGI